MTVINRAHFKSFKKIFWSHDFPAHQASKAFMECLCIGGHHLKRKKKKKETRIQNRLGMNYSQHKRIFLIRKVSITRFHHSVLVEFTIRFSL